MTLAQSLGDNHLCQRFFDRVTHPVPESPFGSRVEIHNLAAVIHRDHCIERGVENGGFAVFTFTQCLLGKLLPGDITSKTAGVDELPVFSEHV